MTGYEALRLSENSTEYLLRLCESMPDSEFANKGVPHENELVFVRYSDGPKSGIRRGDLLWRSAAIAHFDQIKWNNFGAYRLGKNTGLKGRAKP